MPTKETSASTVEYRTRRRLLVLVAGAVLLTAAASGLAGAAGAAQAAENDTATDCEAPEYPIDPGPHPDQDSRERVTDDEHPWNSIALVDPPCNWAFFYPEDRREGYASGFLIAPDVVVTAAHVADPDGDDGGLSAPEFGPADLRFVFGEHAGDDVVVRRGAEAWIPPHYDSLDPAYDVAFVRLQEPVDIEPFEFVDAGATERDRYEEAFTAGFPDNASYGELYGDSGSVEVLDDEAGDDRSGRRVAGPLNSSNGHSGSPIWTEIGGQPTVLGVLTSGDGEGGTAGTVLVEEWHENVDGLSGGSASVESVEVGEASVAPGETVTVTATVDPGPVRPLHVSLEHESDVACASTGRVRTANLTTQRTEQVTFECTVPASADTGTTATQTVRVVGGDAGTADVRIGDAPAPSVSLVDAPAVVEREERVAATVRVSNPGPDPASVAPTLSVDDETVVERSVEVEAGAERTVNLTGDAPADLAVGEATLTVAGPTTAENRTVAVVADCLEEFAACDATDDGLYRDVTGDGAVGQDDVTAFFEVQHRDAWQQDAFDFSENGAVDQFDVVALFEFVVTR